VTRQNLGAGVALEARPVKHELALQAADPTSAPALHRYRRRQPLFSTPIWESSEIEGLTQWDELGQLSWRSTNAVEWCV